MKLRKIIRDKINNILITVSLIWLALKIGDKAEF